MALTPEEETTLKKVAAREDLEKEIEVINATADTARSAKMAEVNAIDDQRITDVKAKKDAIANLEK